MPQTQTDYKDRNSIHQEQYTSASQAGQSKPVTMSRRIGSTTYTVAVHFSETSKESMNDKILRLIRNETEAVG